jgi:hypothetical protein
MEDDGAFRKSNLLRTVCREFHTRRRSMKEEKKTQEIVVNKKDELSEQDLDQACGGTNHLAEFVKGGKSHKEVAHS